MGRAAQFGLVTPPKLKPLPPNSIDPWSERPHRWYRAYSPTIPPIGRPSRFIIQRTRAAGRRAFIAGPRHVAPARRESFGRDQRQQGCDWRGLDNFGSHTIDHDPALLARIERQP